jgi:hypothetical protein
MLKEKNSYIFLAENRIITKSDGLLLLKHSIVFGLDEINCESIFLNPKAEFDLMDKNNFLFSYIGDYTVDNQIIVEENTLHSTFNSTKISNHYEDDVINFIRFYTGNHHSKNSKKSSFSLDDLAENTISENFDFNENLDLRIGKFEGRFETIIEETSDFLFYIIEGAFEIEGCLLEKDDALLLQNFESIEIESLSASAIVVIFSNKAQ